MRVVSLLLILLSYCQSGALPFPGEVIEDQPMVSEPVAWALVGNGEQTLLNGQLRLTSGSVAFSEHPARLRESSLTVEADSSEAAGVILGVRVQASALPEGYFLELGAQGSVRLSVVIDGQDTTLAETSVNPLAGPVALCLQARGQRLRGWVGPAGSPFAEPPIIEAVDPENRFASGRAQLGVRDGAVAFQGLQLQGVPFRPRILSLNRWRAEPRLKIVLETQPGRRYRFEETNDRITWRTQYLIEPQEDSETTTILVPGSFQEGTAPLALTRVVDTDTDELTPRRSLDFLLPPTPRLALRWESKETTAYSFEFSTDLAVWTPIEQLQVQGAAGALETETVLALPESADASKPLYLRVAEQQP